VEECAGLPEGELNAVANCLVAAADQADQVVEQAASAEPIPDEGRKSQSTQLVEIIDQIDGVHLFHDEERRAFVSFRIENHVETSPLRHKMFRTFMSHQFYVQYGKSPGSQAIQDALAVLEGRAIFDGDEEDVHVRYAQDGGANYH
jgi:hypothetical protein